MLISGNSLQNGDIVAISVIDDQQLLASVALGRLVLQIDTALDDRLPVSERPVSKWMFRNVAEPKSLDEESKTDEILHARRVLIACNICSEDFVNNTKAKLPSARAAMALAKSQAYQDADASATLRAYAKSVQRFLVKYRVKTKTYSMMAVRPKRIML